MPWSETTKMQERMRFVLDAQEELFSMTELCGRYGISRVTGHKWLRRFREGGLVAPDHPDRQRCPVCRTGGDLAALATVGLVDPVRDQTGTDQAFQPSSERSPRADA